MGVEEVRYTNEWKPTPLLPMLTARLWYWKLIRWASRRSLMAAMRDHRHTDATRLAHWLEQVVTTVADLAEAKHRQGAR